MGWSILKRLELWSAIATLMGFFIISLTSGYPGQTAQATPNNTNRPAINTAITAINTTPAGTYLEARPPLARPLSTETNPTETNTTEDNTAKTDTTKTNTTKTPREMRGVWVPAVFNLDFPSAQNLSPAAMKHEIDAIVERVAELGFNAIFFQVRPTADAFYPSELFPWSHWLTGEQGRPTQNNFDPLAYIIEKSHKHDIELHAWLNPYRVIHTTTNTHNLNTLAPNNPARLNPDWVLYHTNPRGGRGVIFNPGLPEVRQLILDGFEELIRNYPTLDGIHIDDYFYIDPTTINDSWAYSAYGNGMSLNDWRRENVNIFIRDAQALIRDLNEELNRSVRWGVSPFAIWRNGSSHPLGIPTTRGNESYTSMLADTRLWVTQEWVDYIIPQIYWHIGFEIANFEPILNWWADLCANTSVDLYIGQGVYREFERHSGWESGETLRQLKMIENLAEKVQGVVFYRYRCLRGDLGNSISDYYIQKDNPEETPTSTTAAATPTIIMDTLSVGVPRQNAAVTAARTANIGYNIVGTSDPSKPLYMNGELVTNRTPEGFFAVFPAIRAGANTFTFTQEGQESVTRTITRNEAAPTVTPTPPTVTWIEDPRYVTIDSDAAWVFRNNDLTGGSDWMMARGQQDRIIAQTNRNSFLLSSGVWINQNMLIFHSEDENEEINEKENILKNGQYHIGTDYDIITWQSTEGIFTGTYAYFDGKHLTVNFGMHTEPPPLTLPSDLSKTMFSSIQSGINHGIPYYIFTINPNAKFEGHHINFTNNELSLHLKKRKSLAEGSKPLTGIVFVLDAGHGGTDSGALGPMGTAMPEKTINLINTLKLAERLEALGATVHLTRTTDTTLTLQQRVDIVWDIKPDMFISLHADSVSETTNAANVRGFTVWHRNPNAANLTQTTMDFMHYVNPITNRNKMLRQGNYFICRPAWTPAIITEASFMINIQDFAWLINPAAQNHYADTMTKAILAYFSE
jgi:uncharacterized lipoprotein YddW (UPF0748 family)/N-acetylmuramoyl-L-alanine amidase